MEAEKEKQNTSNDNDTDDEEEPWYRPCGAENSDDMTWCDGDACRPDDFINNVSALRREPSLQGNGFALVSEPLLYVLVPDGATVSWVMAGRLLIWLPTGNQLMYMTR